jgi:hypothetical protein
MSPAYENSVFINCPFDTRYKPLFNAEIFTIHDCGFTARCALEVSNSAKNRLQKIIDIVSQCKYGLHDISRTGISSKTGLPRFNMPLELGIFLGCSHFGTEEHKAKACLIMDQDEFRYRKFISDISGQDIVAHNNSAEKAIHEIRGWLRTESKRTNIPGGAEIYKRYVRFQKQLPAIRKRLHIKPDEIIFVDFTYIVSDWLKENPLK